MRKEVRFAGFGGQGIILAGHILGHAAAINDGKNAVLTQNYGPEARGGASSADVVISDERVEYPKVISPDVLIVMSQEAYSTYGNTLKKDGTLIIDGDMVKVPDGVPHFKVSATRIAEQMGRKIVANIVMLGYVSSKIDFVSHEAIRKSLLENVPKGTEQLNLKAFDAGYAQGSQ